MALEEAIKKSQEAQPIPADKFDEHMKRARETDIESRKKTFVCQSEAEEEREEKRRGLRSSIY